MASLGEFLQGLLDDGRVVFRARPEPSEEDRAGALAVLEPAFAVHRLDVAGSPIALDAPSALAASELVRQACWFLVSRSEPVEEMGRRLVLPRRPRSASEHLSGDLLFRFLPQVHRRARSIAPADRLSAILAEALRDWPLSGVLSDLEEGPADLGDLGGHPGLLLLYAERLARDEKPGWIPRGAAMDYVELVRDGLGRGRPAGRPEGVGLG
jgi:hypothetical protein